MLFKKYEFIKNLNIFIRAMKLLNGITPGIVIIQFFHSLFKATTPYIGIYMSAKIITELGNESSAKRLFNYVFLALILTLTSMLLQCFFGFYINKGEKIIDSEFQNMLSQKSYNIPYHEVENKEIHDLRNLIRMNSDTGVGGLKWTYLYLNTLFTQLCSIIIAIVISVKLFFVIPLYLDFLLALFVIISVIIICSSWIKAIKKGVKVNATRSKANIIFDFYHQKYLNENNAAKDLRIFQHSNFVNQEIHTNYCKPFFEGMRERLKANGNAQVTNSVISTSLICVIYLLILSFSQKSLFPCGDILKYSGTIAQMMDSVAMLTLTLYNLFVNNRSMELFFNFIDIKDKENEGFLPMPKSYEDSSIQFKNVSYEYENSRFALKDVNFTVNYGQRVAIVGKNGSGKSTLIKLLCRLYSPTSGSILLSSNNINNYNYDDYCKNITCVFQDYSLFAFPIGENIAGSRDYNEKKVWEILKSIGLYNRIFSLPSKLNQTIYKEFDENGVELSGGEKQKLAIARALYKDSNILVLDEPTASLDPIAEMEIYEKLNIICKNKTTFFVSHRLNSCKFCDLIIVMDNGKIVQMGTHNDLVENKSGVYYEMWETQVNQYEQNKTLV